MNCNCFLDVLALRGFINVLVVNPPVAVAGNFPVLSERLGLDVGLDGLNYDNYKRVN